MMKNKHAYLSITLILTLLLMIFYSKIIFNPNEYMFATEGDALKNYYVFNSYINSNPSLTEFQQMNYPFNESILFIDSQPSLSVPLRILAKIFPSTGMYSIGIMNILILLSFLLTAIVLYKIFIHLKVNVILSILSAIAITMLNPQFMRLNGHFSLSYPFFIPLTIYLLLKINYNKLQLKYLLFLVFNLFIAFFTHAYLGLICTSLTLLFCFFMLFYMILKKQKHFAGLIKTVLVSFAPILVFFITSIVIDSHSGRTTNPWGIFFYYADFQTIFLPYSGILEELRDWLFPNIIQRAEGVGYIGTATTIVLFIFLINYFIYKVIWKKRNNPLLPLDSKLNLLLLSSLFLLILSMMIPFRYGLELLVDIIPFIKQFRSIGRFSWVFYFVSTISSVFIIHKIFLKLCVKNNSIAYLLIFIFPAALFAESVDYHRTNKIAISKNLLLKKNLSPGFEEMIKSVPEKDYQAFIPIPFFLIGSENFEIYREDYNSQFAMLFNQFTNIPMVANMSGRTSIHESKKIMQLLASDFYNKEIKSSFPNKKPFLVLFEKKAVTANEYALVEKATRIFENDNFYLGEISFDKLFEENNQKEWEEFTQSKDHLFEKNSFLVSDTSAYFEFIDFDKNLPISFVNKENSFEIDNKEYTLLGTIKKEDTKMWDKYFIRFWIYNQGKNYGQDMTKGLVFIDKAYDNSSHWLDPIKKPSSSFEINENWTLVELPLTITEPIADHLIIFNKPMKTYDKTYIKDLLIFKEGVTIYKEMKIDGKKFLFKNNHRIEHN